MIEQDTHSQQHTRHRHPHGAQDTAVSDLESAFGEAETGVADPVNAHRTKGLWLFDNVLFNLTNLSVFALSVFATYKTNFSQARDTPRELQNWWMKRGNDAIKAFKKTGMSEESARNANMVLWSFIDGTAAAPLVAMVEHKRSDIGQWIDDKLGTKPKNPEVYKHQPKEGWKSVFLGRLAAFSIVTPTYFLLNAKAKTPGAQSLNNILFDKTSEAIVKHNVAGIPGALQKRWPELHVKGLVNTAVFETFYTTLCTSILFAVSHVAGKHEHAKEDAHRRAVSATAASFQAASGADTPWHDRVPRRGAGASHAENVAQSRAGPQGGTPVHPLPSG